MTATTAWMAATATTSSAAAPATTSSRTRGGDDNIQGGDGNDVIHGGNGVNLHHRRLRQRLHRHRRRCRTKPFGGPGNDFILGTKADEQNMGNEGDDWLEARHVRWRARRQLRSARQRSRSSATTSISAAARTTSSTPRAATTSWSAAPASADRYIGCIRLRLGDLQERSISASPSIMTDRFFDQPPVPGSGASVLIRFDFVEGLSGSAFADALQGDDVDAGRTRGGRRQRQRAHKYRADRRPAGVARTPRLGRRPVTCSSMAATSSSAAMAATSSKGAAATISSTATPG